MDRRHGDPSRRDREDREPRQRQQQHDRDRYDDRHYPAPPAAPQQQQGYAPHPQRERSYARDPYEETVERGAGSSRGYGPRDHSSRGEQHPPSSRSRERDRGGYKEERGRGDREERGRGDREERGRGHREPLEEGEYEPTYGSSRQLDRGTSSAAAAAAGGSGYGREYYGGSERGYGGGGSRPGSDRHQEAGYGDGYQGSRDRGYGGGGSRYESDRHQGGYGGDRGGYQGGLGGDRGDQRGYGGYGGGDRQPQWGQGGGRGSYPPAGPGGGGCGGGQQGGYGGGGSGRVVPGGNREQHRVAPYDSRGGGGGGFAGRDLMPSDDAQREMLAVLSNKSHAFKDTLPAGSSGNQFEIRKSHGSVETRKADVVTNMFKLTIKAGTLYHYDVTFERKRKDDRKRREDSSRQEEPAAANEKPPENARDIMDAFAKQYLDDKYCCAFDGGKSMVTAQHVKLRGKDSPWLPRDNKEQLTVPVGGVPDAGKGTDWKVTFQLARVLTDVRDVQEVPRRIAERLADGRDIGKEQMFFSTTRQPLEWILRQAFIAAHEVMEVRRTLYFCDDLGRHGSSSSSSSSQGNRNIGGMLRAFVGLNTGIRLCQDEVLLAADTTVSAFLRTDIDLVKCLADLADCHRHAGGFGRGGGRDGGRGGGRGRGRGRSLPEVGEPDVERLMQLLNNDGARHRLLAKFGRTIRNKKLVYKDAQENIIRKFTAVGLTPEPADRATFYCDFKEPTADGRRGAEISVAYYFEHLAPQKQRLRFPQLPAVVMKVPKPKGDEEPRKVWVPMERLWFDKNQRVQAVTHKGGTEQMIEAARKQPADLAEAIQQPVKKATSSSSGGGRAVLDSMQVGMESSMQQIKGRVLPGPWLNYKTGRAGQEETKAFKTGTSGVWNMNNFKFSDPAKLSDWGLVAFLPRRDYEHSLGMWVLDFIKRCHALGMDMCLDPKEAMEVAAQKLCDRVIHKMEWLEAGEDAHAAEVEEKLQKVRDRSGGSNCQLILCFIGHKPSMLYSRIKVVSELVNAAGAPRYGEREPARGLGLVTQVVVASKTDLSSRTPMNPSRRSQYQANLAMKVNVKVGGVNTCWSVLGQELLRGYFNKEVPPIQVFGIDITHPGKVAGARSKAGMVGSLDPAFGRYAWSYWEEEGGGSEVLSTEKMVPAFKDLIKRYRTAIGQAPGCLIVYRDGVSDSELERVRVDEVGAIIRACAELQPDGSYRPRIVYMVVQKRQHVRLFDATQPHQLRNCEPGTVVDHTIVSPEVYDFYLNSHKDIQGAGTNRCVRYICLLDELGFGPDGLQVFTYWLCYLYCRCTRAVSVVAPVYYAHLLAYRVRVDGGDDSMSMGSGSTGSGGHQEARYCDNLVDKMFFL